MPTFKYLAKDPTGRDIQGVVESGAVNQVVADLKKQGLIVINVEETQAGAADSGAVVSGTPVKRKKHVSRKKVKVRDLAVMCRQLGTMLKAGLPLIDALDTIARETENLILAEAVKTMRDDIEGGSTFAEAINKHPKIFSIMFRAMIEAGEASGSLAQIIGQLSDHLKKQDALNRRIKSATMYPKFVFTFFFIIVSVVLLFLIPKFEQIFTMFAKPCKICKTPEGNSTGYVITASASDPDAHQYEGAYYKGVPKGTPGAQLCPFCEGKGKKAKLPAMTNAMLVASRFIKAHILIVLAIIIGIVILWKQYKNSTKGQIQLQKFFMKLPIVGPMIVKSAAARFSMSLSTLLHNGVPLDQALDITGRVSGNAIIAESTEHIRENIVQGRGLAESMAEHPIYPDLVVKMVAVGEESGALAEMLADISEYYEEEVTQTVDGISSVIEPMMIVMIGAVVAVIVLGLYLPIFNLGRAITKGGG